MAANNRLPSTLDLRPTHLLCFNDGKADIFLKYPQTDEFTRLTYDGAYKNDVTWLDHNTLLYNRVQDENWHFVQQRLGEEEQIIYSSKTPIYDTIRAKSQPNKIWFTHREHNDSIKLCSLNIQTSVYACINDSMNALPTHLHKPRTSAKDHFLYAVDLSKNLGTSE